MSKQVTILGRQPPTDSAILVGNADVEMPAEGWDVLKEKLWLPHPYFIRRGEVRFGPSPEGGSFIVQDFRTVEWYAGKPVVEVLSYGIAAVDGKDYKLEFSGQVGEDLGLMRSSLYRSIWRIGYPRVTKLWVSLEPVNAFDHIGFAGLPPDTFGLPAVAWQSSYVADDNWTASGWMGEGRNVRQLPGATASLITDSWLYDPGYNDRDGSGQLQIIYA